MNPGIHSIDAQTYHRAHGISRSALEWIAPPKTPAHFRAFMDGLIPSEESDALTVGTITHRVILEPDSIDGGFAVKPEGMNFATKDGKAWREANGDKPIITAQQAADIAAMKESVWNHPAAAKLIRNSDTERSLFADDDGLLLKARYDLLPRTGNIVADLKTCSSADQESVDDAIGRYGYHKQAAYYLRVAALLGLNRTTFVFIFVEKTPPYCVAVYQLDPIVLDYGRALIRRDLALLKRCKAENNWPGYGGGIGVAALSPWRMKEAEQFA